MAPQDPTFVRLPIRSSKRTLMHPGSPIAALAGVTTTVAPYIFGLSSILGAVGEFGRFTAQGWLVSAGCLAMAAGGLTLSARRLWDQVLITAGVLLVVGALAPSLTTRPGLALLLALFAGSLIFESWESDWSFPVRSRSYTPTRADLAATAARAAAATALMADLGLLLFLESPPAQIRLLGLGVATVFAWRWAWMLRNKQQPRAWAVALAPLAAFGLGAMGSATGAHVLFGLVTLLAIPKPRLDGGRADLIGFFTSHPGGPLAGSFFVLCTAGSLALHAPAASTVEGGISFVDALFTAVSAVCVTGLIVLDTPNDFSLLGQCLILALIQLGALGIMSYSAAVFIGLGRRLRMRDETMLATTLNVGDPGRLRHTIFRLLAFTFGCEAVGTVALSGLFVLEGDAPLQAVGRGVFTAVSAFCNAGFALQTASLIPYQQNALILHVVGVLIILGGLSPAVALAIPRVLDRKEKSAQIKLALAVTGLLLVGSFAFIAAFEWNNSLAGLPLLDRLHNAWFQSVTLRTAGFNSIDFTALRPVTLLVMMTAMFVGGCPGSTAGGIKTTTAAVMILAVVAAVRGTKEIVLFGRRIPSETVDRAAAISTLGFVSLFATVILLLLTQEISTSAAVFEAVSALATVGLSTGATLELDAVGKVIIAVAMFAGRVGPLSMFAFLSIRETHRPLRVPAEPIDVG